MVHLLRKYDVARFARNDVMFAIMCRKARIIREANIIDEVNIICRRQTSFKKRTFVGRQKFLFCCLKRDKRSKIEVTANKRSTAYDDHFLNCTVKLVNLLRKLEK